MNEPTEFKYPLDEYGEPYFAGSHVDAIEGMQDIKDRLKKAEADIIDNSSGSNTDIQNINNRLDKAESDISTNLSSSNTKFQNVNNRLDKAESDITNNFTTTSNSIEQIDNRLKKAESDIADNSTGSNSDIERINGRLDKVESDVTTNLSNNNTKFQTVDSRLDKAESDIKTNSEKQVNLENALEGYMGTTGWVSYANSVASGVQTNTLYGGTELKCEIKEVRIGIEGVTPVVRYKTITYNLRNFNLGTQVAQLPAGFITKAQAFPAFGNGNMSSYRIEITKDGKMNIFGGSNDKTLPASSYWVYGQHTWIE